MAVRFILTDHIGAFIQELPVLTATHRCELNAEDELILSTTYPITYGDRILWNDGTQWREHVVDSVDYGSESTTPYTCTCTNALQFDLRLTHIPYLELEEFTAQQGVAQVLSSTAWTAGACDDLGEYEELYAEYTSAYDALLDLRDTFEAEIEWAVDVGRAGVTRRTVRLVHQCGRDTGLRFDYGYGMTDVTRSIGDEDVMTACYGYGESAGSGEDSKLTFELINGGRTYITRDDMLPYWGLPDGRGGVMHAWGVYENPECEDEEELFLQTREYLDNHCEPSLTYTVKIPLLSTFGIRLGDAICVTDKAMDPPLIVKARVSAMERDLMKGTTESVTFGNPQSLISQTMTRALALRIQTRQTSARVSGLNTSVGGLKSELENQNRQNANRFEQVDNSMSNFQQALESQNQYNEQNNKTIEELNKTIEELRQAIEELQARQPENPDEGEGTEGGE